MMLNIIKIAYNDYRANCDKNKDILTYDQFKKRYIERNRKEILKMW